MKTESTTGTKVKSGANYVLILLSSFGLSYCLAKHFIFDKELSVPLLLISTVVLGRSLMPHLVKKGEK